MPRLRLYARDDWCAALVGTLHALLPPMRAQKPWHATNVCDDVRGCFGCFRFVCLFLSPLH